MSVPVLGSVFILRKGAAAMMHRGDVPGSYVDDRLPPRGERRIHRRGQGQSGIPRTRGHAGRRAHGPRIPWSSYRGDGAHLFDGGGHPPPRGGTPPQLGGMRGKTELCPLRFVLSGRERRDRLITGLQEASEGLVHLHVHAAHPRHRLRENGRAERAHARVLPGTRQGETLRRALPLR